MVVNQTLPVLKLDLHGKQSLDEICASKTEPIAFYYVEKEVVHMCHSKYTVAVVVCSVAEEVVGIYSVVWGQGSVAEGSGVSLKLTAPSALSTSSGTEFDALYQLLSILDDTQ